MVSSGVSALVGAGGGTKAGVSGVTTTLNVKKGSLVAVDVDVAGDKVGGSEVELNVGAVVGGSEVELGVGAGVGVEVDGAVVGFNVVGSEVVGNGVVGDGVGLGLNVGFLVGLAVGFFVGYAVGFLVGLVVGLFVGFLFPSATGTLAGRSGEGTTGATRRRGAGGIEATGPRTSRLTPF